MTLKWAEVQARPDFQALPPADQEAARVQYFDQVVAPQIDASDHAAARSQFDAQSRLAKQALPEGVKPSGADVGAGRGLQGGPTAQQLRSAQPLTERIARGLADAVRGGTKREHGGLRSEVKPYAPAGDGMQAPILENTYQSAGPSGALADIRANTAARDERLRTAPAQAPVGGSSVLDSVPPDVAKDVANQALTPQQAEWMSVAPWRQQQIIDAQNAQRPFGSVSNTPNTGRGVEAVARAIRGNDNDPSLAGEARRFAADAVSGSAQGWSTFGQSGGGLLQAAGEGAGLDKLARFGGHMADAAQDFQRVASGPGGDSVTQQAFSSIVNNVGLLPFGAGTIPMMAVQQGGQSYHEARAAGKTPLEALDRGVWQGLAEAIGEKFSVPMLQNVFAKQIGRVSGKELGHTLAEIAVKEQIGEQLTTAMQDAYDKAGIGGLKPDMTLADYLNDAATTAKVTLMQSALMSGGAAGAHRVAAKLLPKPEATAEDIARSKGFLRPTELRRQYIENLDDYAAEHGLPPKMVNAIKGRLDGVPLRDVPVKIKAAVQALNQHGLFQGPTDEAALAAIDQVPPEPQKAAPAPATAAQPAAQPLLDDGTGLSSEPAATPAEPPSPPPPATVADVEGEPLNRNWSAFKPESGSLNLPREQMPQISAEHRGALVNFLGARGVAHETIELPAGELKPTQGEFSPKKVQQAREFTGGDRSILVSGDGYILDGTHQWLAKLDENAPVKAIRLDAPIQDLLRLAHQFPSSFTASGAKRAAADPNAGAPAESGLVSPGSPEQPAALAPQETHAAGVAATTKESQHETVAKDALQGGQQARGKDRIESGRAQGSEAGDRQGTQAAQEAVRVIARAGRTALQTEPLELRPNADGTLTPHLGKDALVDYDSGEPLRLPADVTDAQAKKAIRDAGSVSAKVNFYPPAATQANSGQRTTSFKTAKGSTYTVHEDGTTTRDKAARKDVGHEGDSGAQERSQRTFYVDQAGANALSEFQTQGAGKRRIIVRDGKAAVQYDEGSSAGKVERRTLATVHDKPAAGLTPVELWKDGAVVHFGNRITSLSTKPDAGEVPKTAAEKLYPVRGSDALAKISAQLGGISPKLLADLSQRAPRTRTSKTGKKTTYTTWDNPLHRGHGPLFRTGGSGDLSEIARVLEEEGYLEPGSIERDPIGAAQRAEQIVRDELAGGGSTLRVGDPDAVEAEAKRRRDAAMDDSVPDDILGPLDAADLAESGYADASPEVRAATEELLARADALGIDIDGLREEAAKQTEDQSNDAYEARLQDLAREALQQSREGAAEADASAAGRGGEDRNQAGAGEGGQDSRARDEGLTITAPTKAQVLAQQDALEAERAAKEAPTEKPKSKFTGEQVDIFNTQGSVFDAPAEAPAAVAEKAAAPEPKGAATLAARQIAAADSFVNAVVEQFGLSRADARKALDKLLAEKLVKLDPNSGQFNLKDGRFWDAEVMRRAADGAYSAREPDAPYETDLFGNPLPSRAGAPGDRKRREPTGSRDVAAATAVPPGQYAASHALVTTRQQQLGHAGPVKTAADAANALAYLGRSSVEHLDALVTDAKGKPLAVIGGFKGALSQASVYPATLVGEAVQVAGAANLWLVHNHPSGATSLSRADEYLAGAIANVFDGTGIKVRAMIAVAGDRWGGGEAAEMFAGTLSGGLSAKAGPSVPAQERQIVKDGRLGPAIGSPADAKRIVADLVQQNGGRTGIVLLDAQNTPVAFVPWTSDAARPLKNNGRLDALYRAVAHANAGAAMIAAGNTLDNAGALNLGKALSQVDVRVLDIIGADGSSAAERGQPLKGDVLLSQADGEGYTSPDGSALPATPEDRAAVAKLQAGLNRVRPDLVLDAVAARERGADGKPLQGADRTRAATADLARRLFDKRVVFFRSNVRFANGVLQTSQPGALFVNFDTERPHMAVLGHELLHALRQERPDLYDALRDRVMATARDVDQRHLLLKLKREKVGLPGLSASVIEEEFIADVVGDRFMEPAFWRELAKEQPGGFRKVAQAVKRFLDDIIAKLIESRPFGTDVYLKDVQAAREAVADALRNYSAGEVGTVADEGDVRLSVDRGSQTDSDAFKRWFGDSKVVDAQGKPLVVYHGTNRDFSAFDAAAKGRHIPLPGFYFSPDPARASMFAGNFGDDPGNNAGANVMPAYLALRNPLDVDVAAGVNKGFVDAKVIQQVLEEAKRKGHDGAIIRGWRDGSGPVQYVVFKPEQIKSATGNRGTFGPNDPDIRFSLDDDRTPEQRSALRKAGIAGKQTVRERVRSTWDTAIGALKLTDNALAAARQAVLDQFYGIERAVQAHAGELLGPLPVEQNPYITARLANGATSSVMRGLLLHGQARWAENGQHLEKIPDTKGLLDILEPLGPDLNNWFGWMVGNRAARLKAEGRENNLSEADIKALRSLAEGKEDLFRSVSKEYAAFKGSVLDVAQAAGLIDSSARKVWDHADYIPFYRQIDEKAAFSPTGRKGLAGQSSGIRTLLGGKAALNDPMENLLMNFSRLIDASLKNNAIRKTIAALDGSDIVEKVGYDMSQQAVPADQVRKVLTEHGTPAAVLDAIPPSVFDGMAKLWAVQAPSDPDVVRVMADGKPQFYRVNDPLLLRSLTSFVPFDLPGLGVMRFFKRVLTATVTATPDFMARNFIRDSMATQLIGRSGFNPLKSLDGIRKAYTEAGGGEDMLFAGASFQSGNVNAADPTGTGRSLRRALRSKSFAASASENGAATAAGDQLVRGWEHYREVGEAIENANREAIYEATLKKTGSTTAAAFEAKDLMDFSLRGGSPVYQIFADVLPFFNARVQGLYRLGRADPKRLAAYGALMLGASLLLAAANNGEDWYEELPDFDKDTYWHFKIGGHHFRIPKPFELGVVFATIPERILRYAQKFDSGNKAVDRLWANVRDQLAMDPVPQMVRPALNAWANKDTFRDRPIENQSDEGKLPHTRYNQRTSETTRALAAAAPGVSDATGLSPKKMEYLVNGYLGTAGMYALGLSDMAIRQFQGRPPGPSMRADDLPVVKSFYRSEPARGTVFESDLYKMRREVDEIYKSVKALEKESPGAAHDLQAKEKDKLAVRGLIDRATGNMSTIQKAMDRIESHPAMTPEQKRVEIDRLQVKKNEASKQAATHQAVKAAF